MLTPTSHATITATLPVVGAAIGDITPLFYSKLFAAHPDLLRDVFNRGNQAGGDQPKALAGSVARYATMLVDPEVGDPAAMLSRIAHKHVSLGVTEAQYDVVHTHLFAAIVEVLGDAVTPEVAAAWDEVYWHMARDLIAIEKGLYAASGTTAETALREVTVVARRQESPDTVTFELASPDGTPLPAGRPGQYVSLGVVLPDGARQIRQYSLTGDHAPGHWSISVKRVDGGVAADGSIVPAGEVSTHLHTEVFEGDTVQASHPFGDLVLAEDDAPVVLVSAGIGTTPVIGMLHHLAATGDQRHVTVAHADRSPAGHPLRAQLKSLVAELPQANLTRWYEDLGTRHPRADLQAGLVDVAALDVPEGAQVYICGPLPFMESVRDALVARGVAADAVHYEVFGPDTWLASA